MEDIPASTGAEAGEEQTLPSSVVETPDPSAWKLSFMDRLSEADRQVLVARGQRRFFPAGTLICQEGDAGDALYVVEQGEVAVLKEMSDGRSTLLGYRGRGESLGEMSLVGQQPRFASVVAEEDTELLCIPAAEFPALMSYPGISWAILNVLNDRLHNADLARTSILQAEQRLARRVRRLATEAERQTQLARVREEALELIAHDLRTPLTVIDGCLQMLRNELAEGAPSSFIDILGLAARSVGQLSSLVDALLEAARQEESGVLVTLRPVDLTMLIEGAVENVASAATDSDIRLVHDVAPDLPRPFADAEKLERVVLNLLDNALSYTPSGGRIAVVAVARDGFVEVSVSDTGPGVPADYRETIFERFVRVPSVKGRRKGFGLGLYFCRQVVQAHGGDIWVEPGPGDVGSRFVFTLPLGAQADRV